MGWLELAELLKWPAIVSGAVLFAIWAIGKVRRGIGGAAVAKDDLKESTASLEAIDRAREAKRKAPGSVTGIVESARRGLRKRKR